MQNILLSVMILSAALFSANIDYIKKGAHVIDIGKRGGSSEVVVPMEIIEYEPILDQIENAILYTKRIVVRESCLIDALNHEVCPIDKKACNVEKEYAQGTSTKGEAYMSCARLHPQSYFDPNSGKCVLPPSVASVCAAYPGSYYDASKDKCAKTTASSVPLFPVPQKDITIFYNSYYNNYLDSIIADVESFLHLAGATRNGYRPHMSWNGIVFENTSSVPITIQALFGYSSIIIYPGEFFIIREELYRGSGYFSAYKALYVTSTFAFQSSSYTITYLNYGSFATLRFNIAGAKCPNGKNIVTTGSGRYCPNISSCLSGNIVTVNGEYFCQSIKYNNPSCSNTFFPERKNNTCLGTKKKYSYYTYSCPTDTNVYGNTWEIVNPGGDCGENNLAIDTNGDGIKDRCNKAVPNPHNCERSNYRCSFNPNAICVLGEANLTYQNSLKNRQSFVKITKHPLVNPAEWKGEYRSGEYGVLRNGYCPDSNGQCIYALSSIEGNGNKLCFDSKSGDSGCFEAQGSCLFSGMINDTGVMEKPIYSFLNSPDEAIPGFNAKYKVDHKSPTNISLAFSDVPEGYYDIGQIKTSAKPGDKVTVDFWMYWNGESGSPIGFTDYNLLLSVGNSIWNDGIGFNSGVGDLYGSTAIDFLPNSWHKITAIFTHGDISQNKLYIDGNPVTLESLSSNQAENYTCSDILDSSWYDKRIMPYYDDPSYLGMVSNEGYSMQCRSNEVDVGGECRLDNDLDGAPDSKLTSCPIGGRYTLIRNECSAPYTKSYDVLIFTRDKEYAQILSEKMGLSNDVKQYVNFAYYDIGYIGLKFKDVYEKSVIVLGGNGLSKEDILNSSIYDSSRTLGVVDYFNPFSECRAGEVKSGNKCYIGNSYTGVIRKNMTSCPINYGNRYTLVDGLCEAPIATHYRVLAISSDSNRSASLAKKMNLKNRVGGELIVRVYPYRYTGVSAFKALSSSYSVLGGFGIKGDDIISRHKRIGNKIVATSGKVAISGKDCSLFAKCTGMYVSTPYKTLSEKRVCVLSTEPTDQVELPINPNTDITKPMVLSSKLLGDTYRFGGKIAGINVWDGELSANQIKSLYDGGVQNGISRLEISKNSIIGYDDSDMFLGEINSTCTLTGKVGFKKRVDTIVTNVKNNKTYYVYNVNSLPTIRPPQVQGDIFHEFFYFSLDIANINELVSVKTGIDGFVSINKSSSTPLQKNTNILSFLHNGKNTIKIETQVPSSRVNEVANSTLLVVESLKNNVLCDNTCTLTTINTYTINTSSKTTKEVNISSPIVAAKVIDNRIEFWNSYEKKGNSGFIEVMKKVAPQDAAIGYKHEFEDMVDLYDKGFTAFKSVNGNTYATSFMPMDANSCKSMIDGTSYFLAERNISDPLSLQVIDSLSRYQDGSFGEYCIIERRGEFDNLHARYAVKHDTTAGVHVAYFCSPWSCVSHECGKASCQDNFIGTMIKEKDRERVLQSAICLSQECDVNQDYFTVCGNKTGCPDEPGVYQNEDNTCVKARCNQDGVLNYETGKCEKYGCKNSVERNGKCFKSL